MTNVDLVAVAIFISLSIITVCVVVNSIDMLRNGRILRKNMKDFRTEYDGNGKSGKNAEK